MRQRTIVVFAVVLLAVALSGGLLLTGTIAPYNAQTTIGPPPLQSIYWMYSVKFICSENKNYTHPNPNGVAPGVYETDINIHNHISYDNIVFSNPHFPPPLNFTKYVVVALSEDLPTTPPVPIGTGHESLYHEQAFRIDCVEILSSLGAHCPGQPYCPWVTGTLGPVTGFVEIIVKTSGSPTAPPPPLDVVAVYTTAPLICTPGPSAGTSVCVPGNVSTLEVVDVPYRQSYP